ncbi:hypothetical protein D3C83_128620 [compost metagenome]
MLSQERLAALSGALRDLDFKQVTRLLRLAAQFVFNLESFASQRRHVEIRFHTSQQFARGERFGQIVVRAG